MPRNSVSRLAFSSLAAIKYTRKRERPIVTKCIIQHLALKLNLLRRYVFNYKYLPQTLVENKHAVLYHDIEVVSGKTVNCKKPDITLTRKQIKTANIIYIYMPHIN